ncbi:TIGR03790 family protein [Verrucomicrobium spinosum]|uniref:TIGR03790 family protein n=1 Tax=Verrucomicrobium spinosum TaxID=2736 RepID=UPI000946222B|nr:TIGR03790 family protein [Verrucomicrobium spinosum]
MYPSHRRPSVQPQRQCWLSVRLRGWSAAAVVLLGVLGLVQKSPAQNSPPHSLLEPDGWDPAAETLVVYNKDFEGSEDLARYYASKRKISSDRVIGLKCPVEETISREKFESTVREPLLRRLIENKWWVLEKRDLVDPSGKRYGQVPQVVRQDIRVVVLMRGVPIRVDRVPHNREPAIGEVDEASVDSEIAALGLLQRPIKGPLENRYYQKGQRFADCPEARGQLLVGRLDAADDATVRRMIDDSLNAERTGLWGRAVVDFSLMDGGYEEGEQWLAKCVQMYQRVGVPVAVDRYREVFRDAWPLPDTILYFGWYTSQITGAIASPSFRFKPGAIACHLHSFSASVLRTKSEAWVGPLLEKGAAAALGNVWEPYLTLTVHFDHLNERLLSGATLGEAAWSSMPGISWMNVVVGDPLYRPFPRRRVMPDAASPNRDYALYASLVGRYLPRDPKKFRRELLKTARRIAVRISSNSWACSPQSKETTGSRPISSSMPGPGRTLWRTSSAVPCMKVRPSAARGSRMRAWK